jgi:hypothetical protein
MAEALASMDGKLEAFRKDKPGSLGYRDGYMAEASDMIQRLETRGFVLKPIDRDWMLV